MDSLQEAIDQRVERSAVLVCMTFVSSVQLGDGEEPPKFPDQF